MGLIYWIVVGLIAGWLAGKVMRGGGMVCWWTSFSAFSVASSAAGCSECSGFGRAEALLARSSSRLLAP